MTFWVAGAAIVGSVGGAWIASNSASDAADKQAEGTAAGIGENRRQFDINQGNQAPYLAAGKTALGQLAAENDKPFDASTVQMDPGYQFGLREGQQAIDRKTAAGGGRISGAAIKEAAQYGTDYATTGYSAAYGRANQARTDRLNRLAALAGVGQTATQNIGANGERMAASNAGMLESQGSNAGAARLAQGNIWGNATNQISALYGRNSTPPPNSGGIGRNPYEGFDAAAAGGWGIE